jgi:hypothetical protein
MFIRFALAAAIVALPLIASAQSQPATGYDKSQDTRLDELEKQLAALTMRTTTTEGKLTDIDKRIESLTTNVDKLASVTADIDTRLKSLDEKVNTMTTQSNTELTTMRKQLGDIARKEGDSYVPNISAAMSTSDKFRQEMETVVNRSLKPAGIVLLANKTAIGQWVFVNKSGYFVRPGDQLTLNVNVGTITTQLPGEEMQTWTVTAPTYQLALDMVTAPTRAAMPPAVPPMPGAYPAVSYNSPTFGAPVVAGYSPYTGVSEVLYRY